MESSVGTLAYPDTGGHPGSTPQRSGACALARRVELLSSFSTASAEVIHLIRPSHRSTEADYNEEVYYSVSACLEPSSSFNFFRVVVRRASKLAFRE